jgi:hypothetical protein
MGCTFTDIIMMSKRRRMRWAGRVVRMGEIICPQVFAGENEEGKIFRRARYGGRIILRWIFKEVG